jgi:Tol biopolymer transport system component
MYGIRSRLVVALSLLTLSALMATSAVAKNYSDWAAAQSIESLPGSSSQVNTADLDGCPILSPDGLSLYMASNRPGGVGGIDIWVAHRSSTSAGFGTPVNLGAPVNSSANDFCPTPVRGKGLFFVSNRPGGCGTGADIYFSRNHPVRGWTQPVHLGCEVNSSADEFSPAYVVENGVGVLYFSSGRTGVQNIYRSVQQADGSFGAPSAVAELNTASDDARPNVRKDGREIIFDSTRPGGLGGPDIWAATRASVNDSWSSPVNLGAAINSTAGETRASLSWDGQTLIFGSAREGGKGSTDIYFSTRQKVSGGN